MAYNPRWGWVWVGAPSGKRPRATPPVPPKHSWERALEPVGDDLDSASSAAVGGLPLAALEATLDVDKTALAEVLRGVVRELTPEDDVV